MEERYTVVGGLNLGSQARHPQGSDTSAEL